MNAMQPLAGALPRDQSDDGALLRPNYEDVVDRAAEFRLTCARVPPELADAADTARALIANAETNTMDGEDAFVDAEIARLRQAAAAEREAAAARADARERAEEERMERERRAAAERQAAAEREAAERQAAAEREAVERQRQAEAAARKAEADRLRAIADAADARERAERLRRDASFARRLKEEQLAADAERERLDRERRERLARDASFARRLRAEDRPPPAPVGLTPKVRALAARMGKSEDSCRFWLEAAGGDLEVAAAMMQSQ